jgi:hypothetical protein
VKSKYKRKYRIGSLVEARMLSYPNELSIFYGVIVGYVNNNDWFGEQLALMTSSGIVYVVPSHCNVISRPYVQIKENQPKERL